MKKILIIVTLVCFFPTKSGSAAVGSDCERAMSAAEDRGFDSLTDVAIFISEQAPHLSTPEIHSLAQFTAKLLPTKPTSDEKYTFEKQIEQFVDAKLKNEKLDYEEVINATVFALSRSEADNMDQHAANLAQGFVQYWALHIQHIHKKSPQEFIKIMKLLLPMIDRISKLVMSPIDGSMRNNIDKILYRYYYLHVRLHADSLWNSFNTKLNEGEDIHKVYENALDILMETFVEYSNQFGRPWDHDEKINPAYIVNTIVCILADREFWRYLVFEKPAEASMILTKLHQLQTDVIVFSDNNMSLIMPLSVTFSRLDRRLDEFAKSAKNDPQLFARVKNVIMAFPENAVHTTHSDAKIAGILRSAFDQASGYNVVLHGRIKSRINDALYILKNSRDTTLRDKAAWFLHHVLSEVHISAIHPVP